MNSETERNKTMKNKNLASKEFVEFVEKLTKKNGCDAAKDIIRDILTDCQHYADFLNENFDDLCLSADEVHSIETDSGELNY